MYRLVHNEQTNTYRVEKRGLLGWAFVTNPRSDGYLGFNRLDAARAWIRNQSPKNVDDNRRWKIIQDCIA